MEKILIVDDDESLAHSLGRSFARQGLAVRSCNNGAVALEMTTKDSFDLILLAYKLPGRNGPEVLKEMRRRRVKTPVIMMTAYGTMETAIEAMKLGAYDYLIKPFDRTELKRLAREALELSRLMKEETRLPRPPSAPQEGIEIIGTHRRMQEVYKLIGQVAAKDVTILITGESGAGKELVARAIYHHSKRKDKPFLALNCAAIPETLFESELFGHERGAFTGAERTHLGKFERCHGGTLFLDEIGEMPLTTQAKLLRVLQYGEIERLGGSHSIQVDVRVIAASNKDLDKAVEQGLFREDLYWRLKIISIPLPPLRERTDDIPALVEYFLNRFSGQYQTPVWRIEETALTRLKAHGWPGNVRELENTIHRAVLLSSGDVILEDHLKFDSGYRTPMIRADSAASRTGIEQVLDALIPQLPAVCGGSVHASIIDVIEKKLMAKVLEQCNYNQVKAARVLGVSRNTLRHRMKKFELTSS